MRLGPPGSDVAEQGARDAPPAPMLFGCNALQPDGVLVMLVYMTRQTEQGHRYGIKETVLHSVQQHGAAAGREMVGMVSVLAPALGQTPCRQREKERGRIELGLRSQQG